MLAGFEVVSPKNIFVDVKIQSDDSNKELEEICADPLLSTCELVSSNFTQFEESKPKSNITLYFSQSVACNSPETITVFTEGIEEPLDIYPSSLGSSELESLKCETYDREVEKAANSIDPFLPLVEVIESNVQTNDNLLLSNSDATEQSYLLPGLFPSIEDIESTSTEIEPIPLEFVNPIEFPSKLTKRKRFHVAKIAKDRGEAYRTFKGKFRPGRELREPCKSNCRLQCSLRIEQSVREDIFKNFWSIADHKGQWDYIANFVVVLPKMQCVVPAGVSKRENSRYFYLEVRGKRTRVCKTMFLNTLGINDQWVVTVCKKIAKSGRILQDQRGKVGPRKNKNRTT